MATIVDVVQPDAARSGAEVGAVGPTAVRIVEAACDVGDVVVLCGTEQRAERIAQLAAGLTATHDVRYLPSIDTLPGDGIAASPAVAGRRIAVLRELGTADRRAVILILTAEAATRRIAPPASFAPAPLSFAPGDAFDGPAIEAALAGIGYIADDRVDEAAEFAMRGVLDMFPAAAEGPVRIEHSDGVVTAIHSYDPITQRSTGTLARIVVDPAIEPSVPRGSVSVFEHLDRPLVLADPDVPRHRERYIELIADATRTRIANRRAGSIPTFLNDRAWAAALAGLLQGNISAGNEAPAIRFVEKSQPARALKKAVLDAQAAGRRVVLLGTARDLRFLSRRIATLTGATPAPVAGWDEIAALPAKSLALLEVHAERGWSDDGLLVITAADILGGRAGDPMGAAAVDPLALHTTVLRIGDAVLHEDHGIGIVRGLEAVDVGDTRQDALRLEYARGGDRLVPAIELDRVWRYGADEGGVAPDTLTGESWLKRRVEIDTAIAHTARGLIELAELKAAKRADPLDYDGPRYERFAGRFAFNETPDQARAIAAVRDDLASGRPMDRLVVGDVGYGKTEVALRAAAMVAMSGRQVAVVAPTTVLVRQHLQGFRKRFEGLGVRVESLSRLSTSAEAKAVKAGLADGSIDIVIGTSAVASKTVRFARLGLVVVDEEQRFGAADKEKLRTICGSCHLLTLTATPIPRTLQSALVGIQQLSVIATPPARRQPTRTTIGTFDPAIIRIALLREKMRGGQSFVVAPRIEDLDGLAETLRGLVPELTVVQAHGKLAAAEIDRVMVSFGEGDGDILLATNIIEAGLDVPRANTMIVWRTDRFGLSQIHQLRGRVGRSTRRGRILLTTEPGATVAEATLKRLRTIAAHDRLGAGFEISARDLDMRGAGDLLGEAQAGHVRLIGVDLYQHLLTGALRTAAGEVVDLWTPELALGIDCHLPATWIAEPELRLDIHARLARATSVDAIDALTEEVEDRFGTPPEDARRTFAIGRIRQLARTACVARIDAGPAAIALTPRRDFAADAKAAGLVAKDDRLLAKVATTDADARIAAVMALLETLIPDEG
ncbi:DEAD/DEAH box helicase [Sphingomonas prati]|uniref:Transcription-repair-coupling factor n=1 Tax=Sphingomonas prati TaxID=1843237 RepID=A0A7W9BT45_9SPHN|nr:DEAD/DEAH box helicase [Sphingomonas prati]MBB5729627.1 transcription-repair coupling factor (superfamily II helicase) [Sphingomonas prati]GGE76011.1 transcription-repair-coupling factor [Sphingomonas prati]